MSCRAMLGNQSVPPYGVDPTGEDATEVENYEVNCADHETRA